MKTSRRMFLGRLTQAAVVLLGFLLPTRARARRRSAWTVRRATSADASELAAIFNAHTAAGICPYSDMVEPWSAEDAAAYLRTFTGTLVVEHEGSALGFGGLIDYADPATTSEILPGAEPQVGVFALHPGRLSRAELVLAAKYLAAAGARGLQRMGFSRCAMRIPAQPVFGGNNWYSQHMSVEQVRKRDGVDHALEVSFDLTAVLAGLAGEGF